MPVPHPPPPGPISRRDFLKITAVAGSALAGGFALGRRSSRPPAIWRETRALMGTVINLAVVGESEHRSQVVVAATFAEMERLVALFDHRRPAAPLAVLNRDGFLTAAPPELVEVIAHAIRYGDLTGGAFDISIKPLLDALGDERRSVEGRKTGNPLISKSALSATSASTRNPDEQINNPLISKSAVPRALVDYRQIQVNGCSITLNKPGMAITLDGIAKGRVVDGAVALLRAEGFSSVLVEAGGDLVGNGHRADGSAWQVGIAHPRAPGTAVSRLAVTAQAVATSGDYQHTFSNNFRRHHIIDPRTGESPPELASVTVAAPSAMDADALSTALMVMGVDQSLSLIERLPHVEALLVTKTLEIFQSSGFARLTG